MNLEDYEIGQTLNEPMSELQRQTIYKLLHNAILTPDEKEGYRRALDCNLTYEEAAGLEQELRAIQLPALDKVKPYEKEVNIALRNKVDRPNT